jgi:hypothetical protein
VRGAMERYCAEQNGKPRVLGWFVRDIKRWMQPKFTGPLLEGGWLGEELERETRPH